MDSESYTREDILRISELAKNYAEELTSKYHYSIKDSLIHYIKNNTFNDLFTYENYIELVNNEFARIISLEKNKKLQNQIISDKKENSELKNNINKNQTPDPLEILNKTKKKKYPHKRLQIQNMKKINMNKNIPPITKNKNTPKTPQTQNKKEENKLNKNTPKTPQTQNIKEENKLNKNTPKTSPNKKQQHRYKRKKKEKPIYKTKLTENHLKNPTNKDHIFYLFEYMPINKRNPPTNYKFSAEIEDIIKISDKILNYKMNINKEDILFITKKFMNGINLIINNYFENVEKIAIVAFPSSKANKQPQTQKTIDFIEKKLSILNCKKLLIRKFDVDANHNNSDRSEEKHVKSIKCTKNLSNFDGGIIILDDICTTGNSISACKKILNDNGANNIIALTAGYTIPEYKLTKKDDGFVYLKKRVIKNE